MCGIAGYVTQQQPSQETLYEKGRSMANTISRRGPDFQQGSVFENLNYNAVFVHSRLSVIDLSTSANQPMTHEQMVVLFNGEIYNYKELRAQLQKSGFLFTTNSDTEVLLKGYIHWKEKLLNKLYGVFSFVIFNQVNGEIFCARDRFGLRPFYYSHRKDEFAFGSLLRTVKKAIDQSFSADWNGLRQNFQFQSSIFPTTCVKEISILPPGCWLKKKVSEKPMVHNYYSLQNTHSSFDYHSNAVEEYNKVLQRAVHRNSVADVPLGLMLSGGIDSSVLAKIAHAQKIQLNAFTLTTEEDLHSIDSEASFAGQLAGEFDFSFYNRLVTADEIVDHIDDLLSIFEEPVSFLEPHFFIGEAMREKGIKVAFSGLGPDELLLGYHQHQQIKRYFQHALFSRLSVLVPEVSVKFRKLKKLLSAKSIPSAFSVFYEFLQGFLFDDLFSIDSSHSYPIDTLKCSQGNFAQQLSELELMTKISSHHALTADKYLMHFGVEGRYPYLDKDVVEFQYHAPEEFKWSGKGKALQRMLANKHLPREYLQRPKTGFKIPWTEVIKTKQLKDLVVNEINALRKKSLVNSDILSSLETEGLTEQNWQLHLYLASINRWWDEWIE